MHPYGIDPQQVWCIEHGMKKPVGRNHWICLPCEAEEAEMVAQREEAQRG